MLFVGGAHPLPHSLHHMVHCDPQLNNHSYTYAGKDEAEYLGELEKVLQQPLEHGVGVEKSKCILMK